MTNACAAQGLREFGCGSGRLTQHLLEFAPAASVSGCDVLSEAIKTCRRRLPRGRFIMNRATPPLPFAEAQFDLIISYSVFTHLSEPNHQAWLKELARLLRPGGIMAHTVHSSEYLKRAAFFSYAGMEVVEYVEGAIEAYPEGCQDLVLLAKAIG